MRSIVLILTATLTLAPLAGATIEREDEVMHLVTIHRQDTTFLAWAPSPGAAFYHVYRAQESDPSQYVLVGTARAPGFVDHDAPRALVEYVVTAVFAFTPPVGASPHKSSCVSASTSGATVTASNCVPAVVWGEVSV